MPIERISSEEAFSRLRSNSRSMWPDGRRPTSRVSGIVKVATKPGFNFPAGCSIMTIGSCFARNIESRLAQLDFNLPMLTVNIPREERGSETANDILNKYTVHSMANELRWAFEGPGWRPEDLFLELDDGNWHDPHLAPNLIPASLRRVIERREEVAKAFRRLPECELVIVTLGLAEAWYDSHTSLYLNGTPPPAALKAHPGRFFLDVLDYQEIVDGLEEMHAAIAKHGHPHFKMLVTVSPVPFKATFTGQDALLANTYSKSVQRAACAAFVAKHDNVDYFPSFEIVTLTERRMAYEIDNIHVKPTVVGTIMDSVLSEYTGLDVPAALKAGDLRGLNIRSDVSQVMKVAKKLISNKQYPEAAATFDYLFRRFGSTLSHEIRREALASHGVALLRARETQAGIDKLLAAVAYDPQNARLCYKLALGFSRLQQPIEAVHWFEKAIDLAPNTTDYHCRYAQELIVLGDREKAATILEGALARQPDHAEALRLLHQVVGRARVMEDERQVA